MNGDPRVRAVSELFAPDIAHSGAHGRWLLLYGNRPRYLLLPKHRFGVQRRCIRVFRRGIGALRGELELAWKRIAPGRSRALGVDGNAPGQAQWLADFQIDGLAFAAVQVGTPGSYQKATVLLLGKLGEPLGLAKVAMGVRANAMVDQEAAWLRRMAAIPTMAPNIPQLRGHGSAGGGRRFLVTDVGPTNLCSAAFGNDTRRFLAELGRCSTRIQRFRDSNAQLRVQRGLKQLRPKLSSDAEQTLSAAAAESERRLRDWSGPLVTAHGDFTPWNARRGDGGLYVFDWEYAWDGATPAHDVLHWLLLPKVLRGRSFGLRTLRSVQAAVLAFLKAAYGQQRWSHEVVSGMTLHYLLDTMVFYGLADGEINFDHPVNRNFFQMLERRRQWMV